MWEWTIDAAMAVVLLISVITDIKSRLIYNKVVFTGVAAAFILQLAADGAAGFLHAAAGFAVGLSLLLIPYLMGGIGAGDVKLLALVGAFQGTTFVLAAAAYMAVIGAGMAMVALLIRRGSLQRIQWTAYCLASIRQGIVLPINLRGNFSSVGYPYGVAIAGGAICGVMFYG